MFSYHSAILYIFVFKNDLKFRKYFTHKIKIYIVLTTAFHLRNLLMPCYK